LENPLMGLKKYIRKLVQKEIKRIFPAGVFVPKSTHLEHPEEVVGPRNAIRPEDIRTNVEDKVGPIDPAKVKEFLKERGVGEADANNACMVYDLPTPTCGESGMPIPHQPPVKATAVQTVVGFDHKDIEAKCLDMAKQLRVLFVTIAQLEGSRVTDCFESVKSLEAAVCLLPVYCGGTRLPTELTKTYKPEEHYKDEGHVRIPKGWVDPVTAAADAVAIAVEKAIISGEPAATKIRGIVINKMVEKAPAEHLLKCPVCGSLVVAMAEQNTLPKHCHRTTGYPCDGEGAVGGVVRPATDEEVAAGLSFTVATGLGAIDEAVAVMPIKETPKRGVATCQNCNAEFGVIDRSMIPEHNMPLTSEKEMPSRCPGSGTAGKRKTHV
jgi:hypothetical protein